VAAEKNAGKSLLAQQSEVKSSVLVNKVKGTTRVSKRTTVAAAVDTDASLPQSVGATTPVDSDGVRKRKTLLSR
jgi:hypothetical protein